MMSGVFWRLFNLFLKRNVQRLLQRRLLGRWLQAMLVRDALKSILG